MLFFGVCIFSRTNTQATITRTHSALPQQKCLSLSSFFIYQLPYYCIRSEQIVRSTKSNQIKIKTRKFFRQTTRTKRRSEKFESFFSKKLHHFITINHLWTKHCIRDGCSAINVDCRFCSFHHSQITFPKILQISNKIITPIINYINFYSCLYFSPIITHTSTHYPTFSFTYNPQF